MAKSEIIALSIGDLGLRGVCFAPRGHEGWTRTGGGVWPIEAPQGAVQSAEGDDQQEGTVVEDDKPVARAVRAAKSALGARQVVIALPLSKLLVRVLKMPVEVREDLADAVSLQLDKLSPFPGEELTVGYEVLSETETSLWVFAAAMPAAVFEELGSALNLSKLFVSRTDVSALGWFRSLSGPLQLTRPGRHVLLMDPDGGWDLMILDHGVPVLVRGLGPMADADALVREMTLSLLNAELEAGNSPVSDVVVVSKEAPSPEVVQRLEALLGVPVRHQVPPSEDGGIEGVAVRTGEGASLDLTPQVWRDAVKEARIRKRVMTGVFAAMAVWAVFMGVLFAGPLVYKQMTERVRVAAKAHAKAFKQVSDTRERVKLILSYMDRTYSPLEMLRMTSGYLPQGITLTGFNFKREDGIKISGEADVPTLVYDFKNAVTEDPLFESVSLTGPSASRGKHKFDVDAKFKVSAIAPSADSENKRKPVGNARFKGATKK
jgi:hypothetical protein